MAILLPEVRYYTPADPYNYSVDNRPLYDLAQGQAVLKSAIETVANNQASTAQGQGVFSRISATGTWPLSISIDLSSKAESVWALKVSLFAARNLIDLSEGAILEQVIYGNSSNGTVIVSGNVNQSTTRFGTLECSLTVSQGAPNSLLLTVAGSGFAGVGKLSGIYTIL